MTPFPNYKVPPWQQAATGLLRQYLSKGSDADLSGFLQEKLVFV